MKCFRTHSGFTLIELLVVILILAILMAIALPLYLRAVRDSEKQTCRSNMQTIANAAQAWKVRSTGHAWPATYDELFTDPANPGVVGTGDEVDLISPGPQCPSDATEGDADYVITAGDAATNTEGTIIITCADVPDHNDVGAVAPLPDGFVPGISTK